jgi:hypothetical protein
VFPKTIFSTLFSVTLFRTPSPLRVLELHRNDIRGITIHIRYSEKHDSTLLLVFYYFYVLPLQIWSISLQRVINTFSIISPLDVTKLQKENPLMSHRLAIFRSQCQWTRIFVSLTTPITMGTQLGLKRASRVSLFISVFPETVVSTLLSVILLTARHTFD